MRFNKLIPMFVAVFLAASLPAVAETKTATTKAAKPAKTYEEQAFLKLMGNKSRKQVTDILGAPAKKEVSVKPTNVQNVIGRPLTPAQGGDKVEMWYYNNIVRYDNKNNTYKTTELTFVNGVCRNVAFFNTTR